MVYQINPGNLKDAYAASNSVMCLDKITTKRRVYPVLREVELYAGDGVICYLEGRRPKLALTRLSSNPVFQNVDDAFAQLTTTGLYRVDDNTLRRALDDRDTVSIDLNRILLNYRDEKSSVLSASTVAASHTFLGPEEKKLLGRLFGTAGELKDNMLMLHTARIVDVEVKLPSLDYIARNAQKGAFAQVATISSLVEKSSVDLAYSEVEACKFIAEENNSGDDSCDKDTRYYGYAVVTGTPFDKPKHGAVGEKHFARYDGGSVDKAAHIPPSRRTSEITSRELPIPIVPGKSTPIGRIPSRKK